MLLLHGLVRAAVSSAGQAYESSRRLVLFVWTDGGGQGVNEEPLRFLALIHRPHLGALLRCEGELAAVEGEKPLCTEAVNAAVDCL